MSEPGSPPLRTTNWDHAWHAGTCFQLRPLAGILCCAHPTPFDPASLPPLPCSYGAFWMSLAIYQTLVAAEVFAPVPVEGDHLMLTLWGILVSDGAAASHQRVLAACSSGRWEQLSWS